MPPAEMLRAIAHESPYSSLPIMTRKALSNRVWMRFSAPAGVGARGSGMVVGRLSSKTWASTWDRGRGSRRFTEIMIGAPGHGVKELTLSYMNGPPPGLAPGTVIG